MPVITLREITADTVRQITSLSVRPEQAHFVAGNAISLAEALFSQEAWYRAIYQGESPAGFVMLRDETLRANPPSQPKVGLWRFMIDARFQGQGTGKAGLEQVISHVRSKQVFASLSTSYVPGPGCPEPFYRRFGFRPTGKFNAKGEVMLELILSSNGT
ncbi:MAG TPA: GNAT family N-acetyltransferase [Povalibacter sp.]|uniref:GNAT family N-acetyltransferase n=1 Tax=Povalibacter sp. TaxID=1962978 RepID=UPI002C1DC803|nr:GNAT family N-acetyltransferase [Povalibacter sp.]HMN46869.1 GNAT family N-acetyltransferase [Povalibacter sp.]